MQRIKNYGSFLQAFGLKMTVENLGHEVEFVDYKIEKPIVEYKEKKALHRVGSRVYHKIKENLLPQKGIVQLYDTEFLKMLGVTNKRNYRPRLDVLIIGSDEVFNCLQKNPNVGYSRELFGKENNSERLISYAASCGFTTIEGIEKYNIKSELTGLLSNFDNISVRDENSYNTIKELTGKNPMINVDPVIISNFDKYIPQKVELENYILVYAYANRIKNDREILAIKQFAKKYNKKIVSIGAHQNWVDMKIEAGPFELLAYVKAADFIVTDTFHGSIYSIKYNKQFATITRSTNRQKLTDLLRRFSVEKREVKDINKLEEVLLSPIDFERVNEIIELETEKSINYLKENIRK